MADDDSTTTDDATTTDDTSSTTDHTAPDGDQLGDGGKKALDAERTRAKDAERRAKAAERELERLKTASLSDQERAVAEAKLAGRQEAVAEAGKRLAHAELRAAAAAKGVDASKQLDYLDLSRFVGDDGEPDPAAIAGWVKTLPEPSQRPRGSADQGARGGGIPKSDGEVFAELLQSHFNPK